MCRSFKPPSLYGACVVIPSRVDKIVLKVAAADEGLFPFVLRVFELCVSQQSNDG